MMKVLLVKTSSLGDVVHTLPALTDAMRAIPDIQFDWIVEERFATIAGWHPAVKRVLPIALRRWRKKLFSLQHWSEWRAFKRLVREESYDLVIDAQGLVKSAWLTRLVKVQRCGYNKHSIREPLASYFYSRKLSVSWQQHAIDRIRQLFALALYYPYEDKPPQYGVALDRFVRQNNNTKPYVIFFHGTTWDNKHWPETYWLELAKLVVENGYRVKLAWGSDEELARSKRIQEVCQEVEVMPWLDVAGLGTELAFAKAVVSVDTGFGHLAAAFDMPTIALFGPTDPDKTGILGDKQLNLSAGFECSPCLKRVCQYQGESNEWPACFAAITPSLVWGKLQVMLASEGA